MEKRLPTYVKRNNPPPEVGQGVKSIAKIVAITKDTGDYGTQIKVTFAIAGYESNVWLKWYDSPREGSHLGELCSTIETNLGVTTTSPDEALKSLGSYGFIYVKRKADKTQDGKTYSRFDLVTDELPPKPTPIPQPQKLV